MTMLSKGHNKWVVAFFNDFHFKRCINLGLSYVSVHSRSAILPVVWVSFLKMNLLLFALALFWPKSQVVERHSGVLYEGSFASYYASFLSFVLLQLPIRFLTASFHMRGAYITTSWRVVLADLNSHPIWSPARFTSPSLAMHAVFVKLDATWCGALYGCLVVKFNSCNSLLSPVHTISVIMLRLWQLEYWKHINLFIIYLLLWIHLFFQGAP